MINIEFLTSGMQFAAHALKDSGKEKKSKYIEMETFYHNGLKQYSKKDGKVSVIK